MPEIAYKGTLRMPAEWEPQKSTWIAWPHNKDDWPGKFDHIPFVFGKIISELSRVQLVNILVKDKSEKSKATFFLRILEAKLTNIDFIICQTLCYFAYDSRFIIICYKNTMSSEFF